MVDNLKDLERLLKLCRKQGVTEINLGSVSFKLGDLPQKPSSEAFDVAAEEEAIYEQMPDRILSPEELTFLANGGLPEDLQKELQ